MHTWTHKIKNNGDEKIIQIKALKSHAEHFISKITPALEISKHFKQLSGIHEKPETHRETLLWSLFEKHQLADPEGYQKDKTELINSIPSILTIEQFQPIIEKARALFQKYVPIVDERETQEKVEEREKTTTENHRKIEEKKQVFIAQYCKPDQVQIPEGMMAIYLEITFDDSNTMVDYFSPHCQIGQDMLLAIVPKQPEKERLYRLILERYPELSKLNWTWHTENYSMGHGNYLISEYPEGLIFPQNAYDGRKEVHARYEIRCNSYQREMYPYKDYPGIVIETTKEKPENITIRENPEHQGLEIIFPSKPAQDVINLLKSKGFRWSFKQALWYRRNYNGLKAEMEKSLNI